MQSVLNAGALAIWDADYTLNNDVTNLSTSSGISVGTAKTRIRTALAKIREVLEVEHEV